MPGVQQKKMFTDNKYESKTMYDDEGILYGVMVKVKRATVLIYSQRPSVPGPGSLYHRFRWWALSDEYPPCQSNPL